MRQVAIGIDIGGTNTAIGVVDREGNVLYEKKPQMATPQKRENPNMTEAISVDLTEKYIASLTAEIKTAIDTVKQINPEIEVVGIGIGAPIPMPATSISGLICLTISIAVLISAVRLLMYFSVRSSETASVILGFSLFCGVGS